MSGEHYTAHRTERLVRILEAVRMRGHVHVEHLAKELDVSQATIRRDLAALDKESLLRRTHGWCLTTGFGHRTAGPLSRHPGP
ncbi:MAG: DeoR family transcriptional regulator [Actinobacteria bacterium]|uniref:HTH deoR-type domain-containing protein n=1 Tax=Nostocoides veronense TaxID=330836 RepID=A0ABN2LND2_9MICO|nr:DeoR family transcriptional regulator [Actinomycetota bacterium]